MLWIFAGFVNAAHTFSQIDVSYGMSSLWIYVWDQIAISRLDDFVALCRFRVSGYDGHGCE